MSGLLVKDFLLKNTEIIQKHFLKWQYWRNVFVFELLLVNFY